MNLSSTAYDRFREWVEHGCLQKAWAVLLQSTPAICQAALSHNILITNGALFFPDRQGYNALRLNFSREPEVISRAISMVGRLLKDASMVAEQEVSNDSFKQFEQKRISVAGRKGDRDAETRPTNAV